MDSIWKDSKRHIGIPVSFTSYTLTETRLFRKRGVLIRKEDQISLYHIRDMEVSVSLWQRLFNVGTIRLLSADRSTPEMLLINVKKPYRVRDLIYSYAEKESKRRNLRYMEHFDNHQDSEDDF